MSSGFYGTSISVESPPCCNPPCEALICYASLQSLANRSQELAGSHASPSPGSRELHRVSSCTSTVGLASSHVPAARAILRHEGHPPPPDPASSPPSDGNDVIKSVASPSPDGTSASAAAPPAAAVVAAQVRGQPPDNSSASAHHPQLSPANHEPHGFAAQGLTISVPPDPPLSDDNQSVDGRASGGLVIHRQCSTASTVCSEIVAPRFWQAHPSQGSAGSRQGAVAGAAGTRDGQDSDSDEDTSDEAFERRHTVRAHCRCDESVG